MTGDIVELAGPVEEEDGKLVLRIPLFEGGHELEAVTEGIAEIDGPYLKILLPAWLVTKLDLRDGSRVAVDNRDRSFNVRLVQR